MITKELNGGRIRIGRTEMDYKHGNEILTSAYPLEGPGTPQRVMGAIDKAGLLRPTTAQIFSLMDFALSNPDEEQCEYIISRAKNQWLWTATENLWGKEDVILYDNVDGNMPSDRASLIKRMKDGDKAVRVVKYGFKTGRQSVSDLVANPYIIGQVGDKDFVEDVVARVAKNISKRDPCVYAFYVLNHPTSKDTHSYTALDLDWANWAGIHGLEVDGECYDDSDIGDAPGDGYAPGILPKKRRRRFAKK